MQFASLGLLTYGPINHLQHGYYATSAPGSVVGIATGYGLDGPVIESRWGGGARFSAPVQTGPGAHLASSRAQQKYDGTR